MRKTAPESDTPLVGALRLADDKRTIVRKGRSSGPEMIEHGVSPVPRGTELRTIAYVAPPVNASPPPTWNERNVPSAKT